MADREQIRQQMKKDGVEFILAQFVDLNGSAKVKMVPASSLDDMIDGGAGFAGAAVLGLGQGPHDHDMSARIDLDSYTPLPWLPNTARFAGDLFVDGESYPYCSRANFKRVLCRCASRVIYSTSGWNRNIFLSRETKMVRSPPGIPTRSIRWTSRVTTFARWRLPWPICKS